MQRYHGASGTSAVNNGGLGGLSSRDTNRADSSSLQANFSLNSRRSVQLIPYRLKCEKESLNSRLGPPDFHPPTPNCPEETLTRDYAQSGYRETVDGIEVLEIPLFLVHCYVNLVSFLNKGHLVKIFVRDGLRWLQWKETIEQFGRSLGLCQIFQRCY